MARAPRSAARPLPSSPPSPSLRAPTAAAPRRFWSRTCARAPPLAARPALPPPATSRRSPTT
eukprot:400710-Rhodomonas_salina.1